MLESLQARLVDWANEQEDIRALLVVGSRARREHPADALSDLDLLAYSRDPQRHQTCTWLRELPSPWVCLPYERGDGYPEHIALFDNADKVDVAVYPLERLEALVGAGQLDDLLERGYIVLVDKDGLGAQLPAPSYRASPGAAPNETEFAELVERFWYDVARTAKQIRRNALWFAKMVEWPTKTALLTMMEWHARARHGLAYDTWNEGRFMNTWADPDVWDEVHHVFGGLDMRESWRALLATCGLFQRLAVETAQRLGYAYPAELDAKVTHYIHVLYGEDVGAG